MMTISLDRLAVQAGPRHLATAELIAADIAAGRLAGC